MYLFTKNLTPTQGALHIFLLKELLKSAGWTVQRSGDGLALYSATADILTSGNSGAAGLGNFKAWFVIRQPGPVTTATRELCFQCGIGDDFRLKYSWNAHFLAGSPSAIRTPSATDEVVLLGSGSDAAPAFAALFPSGYGTSTRAQFIANNAPPYDFASFSYPVGGGAVSHVIMMDGMAAGSYSALDVDPYVFYFDTNIPFHPNYFSTASNTASGPFSFYKRGLPGQAFVVTPALRYADLNGTLVPGALGADAYESRDQAYPILYARSPAAGAPSGIKGQSTILRWCSNSRNTGDTFTFLSPRDFICAVANAPNCVALPWDGSVPLV